MDVFVETQPCVVDLKDPVNEGFDQPQLVTKRCKTQKIGQHTREGLFTISGGHREMWGFVVQKHIVKREHVVNFLLHRKMNVWVLIVDKIKEKDGVMLQVKKAKCVVHITPVKIFPIPYIVPTTSSHGAP